MIDLLWPITLTGTCLSALILLHIYLRWVGGGYKGVGIKGPIVMLTICFIGSLVLYFMTAPNPTTDRCRGILNLNRTDAFVYVTVRDGVTWCCGSEYSGGTRTAHLPWGNEEVNDYTSECKELRQ